MEIEGRDGSKTKLKPNITTIFGRHNLSHPKDLSVSRNHISFHLLSSPNQANPRISFEVLGKNPIWIYTKNGGKKVTTFKRFQGGTLDTGDLFCVSGKNPAWFTVNKVNDDVYCGKEGKSLELGGEFDVELTENLENNIEVDDNFDYGFDSVDVSSIDPVQEFGFLVIGHEFDRYPKKMIRDIKNWDWFLVDPIRGSDDDDDEPRDMKGKKGGSRKRKKASRDDDVEEDWTAESEGEELTTNATKLRRPKYHTRSKDPTTSHKKKSREEEEVEEESVDEYEDDDEEDQTLGGFIVDDKTIEEEERDEIDDDDEEEFVEDEDNEVEE